MNRIYLFCLCLLGALLAGPVASFADTDFSQPDCSSLQTWAKEMVPGEMYMPFPSVEISTLFQDGSLKPVFGKSVHSWEREDFNAVLGWLNDCRKQAFKKRDQETGKMFGQTLKAVKQALRPMKMVWSERKRANMRIQQLIDQDAFPELPQILSLAQDSLQGRDGTAEVQTFHPRYQGLARQASELGEVRDFLSAAEIETFIARLEERRTIVTTAVTVRNEKQEALLKEIAEVPLTRAGLSQVNRIASRAPVSEMSREEVDAYNQAIQFKRSVIQRKLAAEEAAAELARATQPSPVLERLAVEVTGASVSDVSIRGLAPGMDYDEAKALAERQWGYGSGAGGDLFKQFTSKGRDVTRYTQEERRDGGMLLFETMSDKVGKLTFIEHYTGPTDIQSLRTALVDRFGTPKKEGTEGNAAVMAWEQGGRHLRIVAGARIADITRSNKGFHSSMEIVLWSQKYTDYLKAAEQRCAELRNKPMGDLSVNDRQALLMGCKTP
jgi:hypothetical protein